jgi:hypothetical protein
MNTAINNDDLVVGAVKVIANQIGALHDIMARQSSNDAKRYAALDAHYCTIIKQLDTILEKCGEVEDA